MAAPVARKDQGLSTGALVGIGTGVGVFVLILLVVCCVLYRRQKKQIDEYKQLYFLQQSDYKVWIRGLDSKETVVLCQWSSGNA